MRDMANKQPLNNLLLEIGTEPLPASFIYSAIRQLKKNAQDILKSNNISFGSIETFDTYRRLVIYIKDVNELQNAKESEVRGPSKEIAYDENNKPTKALLGFLNKTGIKQIDIEVRKTSQGEYVFGVKKETARKVSDILPDLVNSLIASISCDKNMHWNKGVSFIRPIRWVMILWKQKPVSVEVAGIKSSNLTYAHQLLSPKPHKVKSEKDYFSYLKKNYVELDFNSRRDKIEKAIITLAAKCKGELSYDIDLLDELTNLCECPGFISGAFSKKYLSLPDEVLITSMKKGQKLFAVKDKNKKVMPVFLAVIDNRVSIKVANKICQNYEKVLEAKLNDSEFFLKQDTREPLSKNINKLKDIIFQKDLGSMYDKSQRLVYLSDFIAHQLGLTKDKIEKVKRCAFLAKADLVTDMVGEFPDLQGVVGSKYASRAKEEPLVCEGILEHYQPKSQDDDVPKSITGVIVSLADKLDNITSYFSLGLIPSGSYDPYALRRSALGIVRVILKKKISISMSLLINKSISLLAIKNDTRQIDLKESVHDFLNQRLRQVLLQEESDAELIESVITANSDDYLDVVERISQLKKIRQSKDFFECSKIVERTSNILKKAPKELPSVNQKLFKEELEKQLWAIFEKNHKDIRSLIEKKKYIQATEKYVNAFNQPVHVFFDKIMVNVDNAKVRNNRLSLMKEINQLYSASVADLSRISINSNQV
jgi:glycyl-tRNA synthetase beta chain